MCFHKWQSVWNYSRQTGHLCEKCGLERMVNSEYVWYRQGEDYNTELVNGKYKYKNPLAVMLKSLRIINKNFPHK